MSNQNNSGAASRAASAIANIAKGAAAGGLHGAAAGAAKSFLPKLVKAAVIVIAVLIFLPLLAFTALPNIMFGYDSAGAEDIIQLTDKAYSIDAAYKEVQNYSQAEVDRIVAETVAAHTTKDGPEFDNIDVTADTDNTNIYWLIAITSVSYNQDLYAMDENAIRDMTVTKIIYSSSIVSTVTGEGDEATTTNTLKIDIEDLDPEALMDKLGFTAEERNWAHVLYSSMTQDQYVGIADSDGPGYYDTDYGAVVFADASTPVVYYNQTDSRWGHTLYGKTGTIGTSGCGPTALAIVVASLKDSSVTPADVAKWSYQNGYRAEGNGSYRTLMTAGGAHYGLTVEGIGNDGNKLVEALKEGKLAIAIMAQGHFTSGGHFIVLRGVTADGKILVADPASVKRSNQEWDLKLILNETSNSGSAGGPIWIFSP